MKYPAPPDAELRRFLAALRSVESGGRYEAVNPSSGARGAYQIMPANWPAWASRYLGDRRADWTPANQDAVARGKVRDLYRWLGDWRRVAAWWLAGGAATGDRASWSPTVRRYVAAVMDRYDRSGSPAPDPRPAPSSAVAVPAAVELPPATSGASLSGCGPVAAVLLALGAILAAGAGAVRLP